MHRRDFLKTGFLTGSGVLLGSTPPVSARPPEGAKTSLPVVIATYRPGQAASEKGYAVLKGGGSVVSAVEEAVKLNPAIYDCLVVGVPDERFGERVVAVAAPRPGDTLDEADLITFLRDKLAGYKLPKHVVMVDKVQRAPNGKADYKWAKATALDALGIAAH